MTRVRLSTSAEQDVARAVGWYDRQQPGIGTHFLLDLHRTLDRIGLFPDSYPAVGRAARRALLARFPYAVAYRPAGDEVVVLAVLHDKRHGNRTRDRNGGR